MDSNTRKKITIGLCIAILAIIFFGVYVPGSFGDTPLVDYTVERGVGYKSISWDLQQNGVIKNDIFFKAYVLASGNYGKLQAGDYRLSSSMSVADMVKKLATGDVIKNNLTVIEGWDLQDIADYLDSKKTMSGASFFGAAKKDDAQTVPFLVDKPQKANLEGYIFPDTYELSMHDTPDTLITKTLVNFDKKLTPDLRAEISKQKKTIFQVITMASILEKEVQTPEDKKIVAGILWKRIKGGIPLQVDATINYITGKNHAGARITDTQIDSPYNTYKYYGLPKGPICNPGLDSIKAAIYPTKTDYWYYLSATKTGHTIFSKTLEEHNAAAAKYLKP